MVKIGYVWWQEQGQALEKVSVLIINNTLSIAQPQRIPHTLLNISDVVFFK